MLLHLHFELLFYATHDKNHALLAKYMYVTLSPIQVAFIHSLQNNIVMGESLISCSNFQSTKFAKLFPIFFPNEVDHVNKDPTHGCKHLERNLA